MPTPFIMPKMDMDQETVHIDEWLKKEGDLVTKGEPVVVIETDKITSEVEAPATGKLTHLLYGENVDVPVTKVIAYILAEGETEADLPEMDKPAAEAEEKPVEEVAPVAKGSKSATPVAKRMMEENNLSLEEVPASGEKITKEDVEAYLDGLNAVKSRVQTPATPAARRIASENKIEINQISGSGPTGSRPGIRCRKVPQPNHAPCSKRCRRKPRIQHDAPTDRRPVDRELSEHTAYLPDR